MFTIEKLERRLPDLKAAIYRRRVPLPVFKYQEQDIPEARDPAFDDRAWPDFTVGGFWGGYDVVAWFRTGLEIPSELREDKKLGLRFLVGPRDGGDSTAEAMLYVQGQPLQGIDIWHEEAWLPPELYQDGKLQIALRVWSGVLGVPVRRHFKLAELVWIDETAEAYYYLLATAVKTLKELADNDLRRVALLRIANQSYNLVKMIEPFGEEFYFSVGRAYAYLVKKLAPFAATEELKPRVVGVGHAHIDLAWLWRLKHTREKAQRTFATVLHLMRQYPAYRFMHSSPQLYKFLKADAPDLYAQVKERINNGQWEITGGMWVEADTNLPNGESLIRQFLFGKRFIREEFGCESHVVWLPDVFGYTWALPQIMKKCGMKYLMTTKLSWNQYNRIPYDTFYWRGMDGSEVLTHFITTPDKGSRTLTYNGPFEPYDIKGIWDHYQQKAINNELLLAFGWGDGGGGPTKEMLETGAALKNLPGMPAVSFGKTEPYFERLEARLSEVEVPVWDGELYLEYHRGTYTSQGWIKRANRKAEVLYHNAEWLNVLALLLGATGYYPQRELNGGWEQLLYHQFHDILPGSSICQVYEDARTAYERIREVGKAALVEAKQALCRAMRTAEESLVVFNPLPFRRTEIIEVPYHEGSNPPQVTGDGPDKKTLYYVCEVPAYGYKTFSRTELEKVVPNQLTVQSDLLENQYYRLTLNAQGQLVSIYDRKAEREILPAGEKGNVWQAFEDRPLNFDAWDIDRFYWEKREEINELIEAKVVEEGPLRGVLKLVWQYYDSRITQWLTIYDQAPRVDFRTEVDWAAQQTLLKVAFPVEIRATTATYDLQFGNIERATHTNTSWDWAKFEAPGQKWIDLSEGDYGVSLLNDCKYGFDVHDGVMRITLIKSPVRPDESADRGRHLFTYSLYAHQGPWRQSRLQAEAYALNYPLLINRQAANAGGNLPTEYELVRTNADHIMIETVKKAEDDDGIIIRLYEYKQIRQARVDLHFAREIAQAVECNLIEEEPAPVVFHGKCLSFPVKPYEIKTFKVWFK